MFKHLLERVLYVSNFSSFILLPIFKFIKTDATVTENYKIYIFLKSGKKKKNREITYNDSMNMVAYYQPNEANYLS